MTRIQSVADGIPDLETRWVSGEESIRQLCEQWRPETLIVDLQAQELRPLEEVRALKAALLDPPIHVVGYLPHVDLELRERAREAGVDRILVRSAFSKLLPELLR